MNKNYRLAPLNTIIQLYIVYLKESLEMQLSINISIVEKARVYGFLLSQE